MWRTVILVVLVAAAGCASTAPPLSTAEEPTPDPTALLGWWAVEGTDAVLLFDPVGLEVLDGDRTLVGSWRADAGGRMIAVVDTGFAAGESAEPVDAVAPDWLAGVAGFRVDGPDRVLLDGSGAPVARLVARAPVAGSGLVDPATPLTPEQRAGFGPAAPPPAELRPADPAELLGRWVPEAATAPAYVELTDDGRWTGSDGCNGTGGEWLAGAGGGFLAVATAVSTLMACEGSVDVAGLLGQARTAAFDGPVLVLLDARGEPIGRFGSR